MVPMTGGLPVGGMGTRISFLPNQAHDFASPSFFPGEASQSLQCSHYHTRGLVSGEPLDGIDESTPENL